MQRIIYFSLIGRADGIRTRNAFRLLIESQVTLTVCILLYWLAPTKGLEPS